jgi:hypothetical protein
VSSPSVALHDRAVELPIVKAAILGWQAGGRRLPNSASRIWEGIRVGLRDVAGTDQLATFRTPVRLRRPINASELHRLDRVTSSARAPRRR